MKYSVCVNPKTVETVDGMNHWIDFFYIRYRSKVKDFDLRFDGSDLKNPIKCIIRVEGPVLSFARMYLEYQEKNSIFIGW